MTILVTDRDIEHLAHTESLLRQIFPEDIILTYIDSMLAAQYSFNNQVEIVFGAWCMRRMNGLDLASFVRKARPYAQIYLTACPEERVGGVTRNGEADYMLGEPLTEEALRDAIALVKERRGDAG